MLMRRPVGDFYVNTCLLAPLAFQIFSLPFLFQNVFRNGVSGAPYFVKSSAVKSRFTCRLISTGIVYTQFSVQLVRKKGLSVSIEIYGSVFLAIIDGWMEFWTHGHSKSLRKELANHRE